MIPVSEKIAIGLPRGSDTQFAYEFMESLWKMCGRSPCQYKWLTSVHAHHIARNNIIKNFLKSECNYLLFIDSDMIWQPESLEQAYDLLQQKGVDLVTGIYFTKSEPFMPVIKKMDMASGIFSVTLEWDNNPFQVDGAGMGFMLIPRRVLEKMKDPYCSWDNGLSEDLNFCIKVRSQGNYKLWAHPGIKLGHYGKRTVTNLNFAMQHKDALKAWVRESMRSAVIEMREKFPNWRWDLGIHPLQFKNINTKEHWDKVYKTEGTENNWRTYPDRDKMIVDLVSGYAKNRTETILLEVGCGIGALAEQLKGIVNYTGLDISDVAVEAMKVKGFNAFQCEVPPIGYERSDIVVALELFEHLDEDKRAEFVQEVARLIGDKGMAIFSVPDEAFPPDEIAEHRVMFNQESLLAELEKGFENVKIIPLRTRASHKAGYGYTNTLISICKGGKHAITAQG